MSKQETPEVEAPEVEAPAVDDQKAGNPEAAKYRTRLRDTEAERDTLAGQVEGLRRSIVDTELTSRHRVKAEGFWASGVDLADLLDAEGNVDADKVSDAVATAKATLGLSVTPGPGHVPGEGRLVSPGKSGRDWADAFSVNKG